MTIEQLQDLARAYRAMAGDAYGYVRFVGYRGITEALVACGATAKSTVYVYPDKQPLVIVSARLDVEGVEIGAQYNRPATEEEIAQAADADRRTVHDYRYATATVQ